VIGAIVRPVLVGIVIGLVAAYWAGQFMQSLLHQVDTRDPGTLALVALLLVATAVVAGWLPARRATKLDPVAVLRAQ
jgi:ABC-type antimicrobial peptide transport system permease subunit